MKIYLIGLLALLPLCSQAQNILPVGSSWKFLDNGTQPTNDWTSVNFNEASWLQGNAELGYGDGDEVTPVSFGGNASNRYITTYFRKTVSGINTANLGQITGRVKLDDGVVIYVNGNEAFRNNLPAGAVNSSTLALDGFVNENRWIDITLPANLFINGNNTIATEIHQASITSSDISFDLELNNQSVIVSNDLSINEVMPNNVIGVADNTGQKEDWIELYNTGSSPINLLGYYLSDDINFPTKHRLAGDNFTINPNGFLLIWASKHPERGAYHTNFSLSSQGETVYLYAPNGTTLIDSMRFGALLPNISYGDQVNGNGINRYFNAGTPNASNNNATSYTGFLNPAVFSQPGGFYAAAFDLTLSNAEPGTQIYYTTDGSDPDPNNTNGTTYNYKNQYPEFPGQNPFPVLTDNYRSYVYNSPINIVDRTNQPNKYSAIPTTADDDANQFMPQGNVMKGNIIKAIVVKSGYLSSDVTANSYFINPNVNFFKVPVVSIGINPKDFWGYEDGINVAGIDFDNWRINNPNESANRDVANTRRNVEQKSTFTLLNTAGNQVVSTDVGIQLSGLYNRGNALKSYQLKFREEYGQTTLGYPIFRDQTRTNFKRLLLRAGSSESDQSMMRDMFAQKAVEHMDFISQDGEPAVLFINGEFWGLTNIREQISATTIAEEYDVPKDSIDITGQWVPGGLKPASDGDIVAYGDLHNWANSTDMSTPAAYQTLNTKVNLSNLYDYLIAETFNGNGDWPANNHEVFRKRVPYNPNASKYADGRFNWTLWDLDFAYGMPSSGQNLSWNNVNNNYLDQVFGDPNFTYGGNWLTDCCFGWNNDQMANFLWTRFFINDKVKKDFANRYADMLNTTFLPTRLNPLLARYTNAYNPIIPSHMNRFNTYNSQANWNNNITIITDFINNRTNVAREHVRARMDPNGTIRDILLDVSNPLHGYIHINTIDILPSTPGVSANPYPWTGKYFRNIKVKLEAKAKTGWVFSHWETNNLQNGSTSAIIEEFVQSGFNNIKAIFIVDPLLICAAKPIHYWHFNQATNGVLSTINADYSKINTAAATITYTGAGAGYMDRTAITEGTTINAQWDTIASRGIRMRNPSDTRELIINASSAGFGNVELSYATMRTTTGATTQQVYYSISGNNGPWIPLGNPFTVPLTWEKRSLVVSSTEAWDNANLAFKIAFSGAGSNGSSGNNRIDNLVVAGKKAGTMQASICSGQSYPFGGQNYNNTGTYATTLTTSNNCDSTSLLHLKVNTAGTSTTTASICNGQSYTFDNQTLTQAGNYTRTTTTGAGCDSTISLTLSISAGGTRNTNASICNGQSYTFGSQTLTQPGNYTRTTTGADCDSTINLTLAVSAAGMRNTSASICNGQSYTFGNQTLTQAGNYTRTTIGADCDSTINLTLVVTTLGVIIVNQNNTELLVNIIDGATYQWVDCDNGNAPISDATTTSYTPMSSGNYAVRVTANGCQQISNCIPITTVGIKNIAASQYSLYPNPVKDYLNIRIPTTLLDKPYHIVDVTGRSMYTNKLGMIENTISIANWAAGYYILQIEGAQPKSFFIHK